MSKFLFPSNACDEMILNLLAKDAYKEGQFILSSGLKSNHYVNCKPVTLSGKGLALLSGSILDRVDAAAVAVAGLTLGADPLVSGVAMAAAQLGRNLNALIVRKEPKGHGTGAWLEGPLPEEGSVITVLEDVVTTGGSSLKAVNKLREAGYIVRRVVTVVDREEGGNVLLEKAGLELVSLFLLKEVARQAQMISK